ncbi:hypothetical protein [Streptomyces sp. NPDC056480]|uniref:hypothetical protein n=1 Tax=Streptomyces sp. NPDC056480 TaxID=3345833 RepID=UPI0036953941
MNLRNLVVLIPPLCLVMACSSSGSVESLPPLGEIKEVRSGSDVVLPLDSYDVTPEERSTLEQIYDLVGSECMRKKGFKVTLPRRTPESEESVYGRRYFILRMDEAERYGYRPERMMQKPKKTPITGLESKSALREWLGHDPDDQKQDPNEAKGCGAAAFPVIEKGVKRDSDVVIHDLTGDSWHRSEEDARVQAVFRRWSACMKEAGFKYSSPVESNNDRRWQQKTITDVEISTAKADVLCKQKTNLAGIWLAVETAYQKRQIEQHAEALRIRRAAWDIRIRNAHEALGG